MREKIILLFTCSVGGSNESDHKESTSTRKCLRKTRVELLFREYEVCLQL